MFGFFKKKSLEEQLKLTKTVRVRGVYFEIKKIDVLAYLEGFRVMQEMFSTYKTKNEKFDQSTVNDIKKAKSFMAEIIVAGVVNPKISLKKDDEGLFVDEIFKDWVLAQELVETIMSFTYGKKK